MSLRRNSRKQEGPLHGQLELVRSAICARLDRNVIYHDVSVRRVGRFSSRVYYNSYCKVIYQTGHSVASAPFVDYPVPLYLCQPYDLEGASTNLLTFVPHCVRSYGQYSNVEAYLDGDPANAGVPFASQRVDRVFQVSVEAFTRDALCGRLPTRFDINAPVRETNCMDCFFKLLGRGGVRLTTSSIYFNHSTCRQTEYGSITRNNPIGPNRVRYHPLTGHGTVSGYNFFHTFQYNRGGNLDIAAELLVQGDLQDYGFACGPYSLGFDLAYCAYGIDELSLSCACRLLGCRFMFWYSDAQGGGIGGVDDDKLCHDGSPYYSVGERILVYMGMKQYDNLNMPDKMRFHVVSGTVVHDFKVDGVGLGNIFTVNLIDPQTDTEVAVSRLARSVTSGQLSDHYLTGAETIIRRRNVVDLDDQLHTSATLGPALFLIDGPEAVVVTSDTINPADPIGVAFGGIDMPMGWDMPTQIHSCPGKVWFPLWADDMMCSICDRRIPTNDIFTHFDPNALVRVHQLLQTRQAEVLARRQNSMQDGLDNGEFDVEEVTNVRSFIQNFHNNNFQPCERYCRSCVQRRHFDPAQNLCDRTNQMNYQFETCCDALSGLDIGARPAEMLMHPEGETYYYRHCRVMDLDGDITMHNQPHPMAGPEYFPICTVTTVRPVENFLHRCPGNWRMVGRNFQTDSIPYLMQMRDGTPDNDHDITNYYSNGSARLRTYEHHSLLERDANLTRIANYDGFGAPLHVASEYYRCDNCVCCGIPRAAVAIGPSWALSDVALDRQWRLCDVLPTYAGMNSERWTPVVFPFRCAEMNNTLRRMMRCTTMGKGKAVVWISPVPPPLMRLVGQSIVRYVWRFDNSIVGFDGSIVRQTDVFRDMWSRYRSVCTCSGKCSCGTMAIRFLSADFRYDNNASGWECLETPSHKEVQLTTLREGEEDFVSAHHVVRAYTNRVGAKLYSFYIPVAPTHFQFDKTIRGAWGFVSPPDWIQDRVVNPRPVPAINIINMNAEYRILRVGYMGAIFPDLTRSKNVGVEVYVRRVWQSFDVHSSVPGVSWADRAVNELDADVVDLNAGVVVAPGARPPPPDWRFVFPLSTTGHAVHFPMEKAHQIISTLANLVSKDTTYEMMKHYSKGLVANNFIPEAAMTINARDYIADIFLSCVLVAKSRGGYSAVAKLDAISLSFTKLSFFSRRMVLQIGTETFDKVVHVPYSNVFDLICGKHTPLQLEKAWFRHGHDISDLILRSGLKVTWNQSGEYSKEVERWWFNTERVLHLPWWMGWLNLTSDFSTLFERKSLQFCVPKRNRVLCHLMSVLGKKQDYLLPDNTNVSVITITEDVAWGRFKPTGLATVAWVDGVNSSNAKSCVTCGGFAPKKYHWWCSTCPNCYEYRRKAKSNEPIFHLSNAIQRGVMDPLCPVALPPGARLEVGGPLILPSVIANPKKKPLKAAFYHNGPPDSVQVPYREVCDCASNDPVKYLAHQGAINGHGPKWDFKPRKSGTKPKLPGVNPSEALGVVFPNQLPAVYVDNVENQMLGFKYRIMAQPVNEPHLASLVSARRLFKRLMANGSLFPLLDTTKPMERLSFASCRFLYSDSKAHSKHACSGPFCRYRHKINEELFQSGDDLLLYNAGLIFGDCWNVGWLDGMLPRRRLPLAGGARELVSRGTHSFRSRRFGTFVKRELAATRSPEFVCGMLSGNPRLIQGPPEASHVAAGPSLRVFTKELHENWNFENFITYVGGATPSDMQKYALENMNVDGSNRLENVSYFMNDYSMFDSTYTRSLFEHIVYPIYSYLGVMLKEGDEVNIGRPCGPLANLADAAIRYWERPKGRLSSGVKYTSSSMNASGRDDTAAMNALVNGLCIFASFLSYYFEVPMHHVDRLSDPQISEVVEKIHIAILGDDSLVRVHNSLLRGASYADFKTAIAGNVACWGIEAKPQMENEFRRVVFLGSRPYPCTIKDEESVLWGPTIGRRLYKMGCSVDMQSRPAEWLYSVMDATLRTAAHVPIISNTARAVMKILEERGVALHEYKEENFRGAGEAARKGAIFRPFVSFREKVDFAANKYTYFMLEDIYGIGFRDVCWYDKLLSGVRKLPVLIRDPVIERVFHVDDL